MFKILIRQFVLKGDYDCVDASAMVATSYDKKPYLPLYENARSVKCF